MDVESLCIIPGEKVFSVHCYVNIIDNNGNIFDAAVLAATSSLCYFRRPDYSINGTQVRIYAPNEQEPVPLCLHYQPISISFCLLDSELTLLDPNEREEAVKEGMISLVLNAFGELCGVHFLGGIPVSESLLLRCGQIASAKANDISAILKKALEKNSAWDTVLQIEREEGQDEAVDLIGCLLEKHWELVSCFHRKNAKYSCHTYG